MYYSMTATQKKNLKRAQKRQEKRAAEGWVKESEMFGLNVSWNANIKTTSKDNNFQRCPFTVESGLL